MAEKEKETDVLSEKKLEFITKDISEDIQAEVADICTRGSNLKDPKKCAASIKDTLDRKYGGGWNVIVGEDFTGSCCVAEHSLLQMKVSGILILVFKSCIVIKEKAKPEKEEE